MAESRLVISIDARNAQTTAQNLNKELQNITNSGNAADRQVNVLGGSLRNLAGYMAGIVTVGAAINKMDAYANLQNRLRLVTNGQQELNKATSDTFAIAQKTYQEWSSVVQVYQRFSDNAKVLNINMAQTARLTETVSKAVAISGSTAESAQAALVQFGQALASGTLRGEELNSVMEQTPALAKAIANGMGITIGQLRTVAAEGKITSAVLVDALGKAAANVDEQFSKMQMTIGQSLTLLNNEITKFAENTGGASSAISGSIKLIAQNLELISGAAIVAGIGYLTTAIVAKTTAIGADVIAITAQRAATQAQFVEEVKLATAAVNNAKAHLALTQATAASTQANFGATAAAIKYKMATDAVTQAVIRQEVAEKAAYGATVNMSRASSGLLAFLGGPVGIGVTVATIAAGYLLMRDNTNKATASIEYQGQKVDELVVKYRELNTLQHDNETKALAEQVQDLAVKFRVASSDLTSFIQALPASDEKIQFFEKLTKEYQNGEIKSAAYYDAVKNVNFLTDEQLDKVRGLVGRYGEAKTKFGEAETAQKALAASTRKTTEDVKEQAVGVANLTDKMKELLKTANQNIQDSKITTALASRGYNDTMIDLAKKYLAIDGAIVKNAQGQYKLREDLQKSLKAEYDAIVASKNAVDARNESEKVKTKELEKQQKVLQLSSKIQENASKYNFGGLESKYGLPAGMLSALHAIETGNTGKTNQVNKQSGATGGFQFLSGTAKQYGVQDRNNLAQSAEGAAKYMSYLLSLFKGDLEKAVRAYHAGEGNVQKNKNIGKYNNDYWSKFKGYTASANGFEAGDISSKEFERMLEDATKLYEQQAKARESIELDVADKVKRINLELQQKKEEIEKANFSPDRKQQIIAEYESRAASDIAIANQALKTKLDEYAAFTKSEEALLKDSFDQKKFYASQDIELSKDQKSQAIKLLDDQYKQELSYIELAKEQRIFAAQESYLSESDAASQRYDLEIKEIAKVKDEKERLFLVAMANLKKETDAQTRLNNARLNVANDQIQNSGIGAFVDIEKTRNEQVENSSVLFNEELSRNFEAREQLWKDHTDRVNEINKNADQALLDLKLSYGEQILGSLSSMFKQQGDDQNKYYKAAFTIEKAFAIARSALAIQTGIAQAANNPWPLNLAAMASVAAATASVVSNIKAIHTEGFKTGGYTGNMGTSDVAGVVHGQEYVLNAAATKRVGTGTLDAINSGGSLGGEISVNIQNYGTSKEFDVQQIDANTVRIIARDEAEKIVTNQLSSPNSPISKGIKNNFNTSNRRG